MNRFFDRSFHVFFGPLLILAAVLLPIQASAQPIQVLRIGGVNGDFGQGIDSDGAGGTLATGAFNTSADFDDDGTPDLTSAGGQDVYVARYDAAGGLVFAIRAGGAGGDAGSDIVSDGAGGALVTGRFEASADFDDDGTPDLTSAGGFDIFVARYDAAGDLVFAIRAGGTEAIEEGLSIAPDGAGGAFVTGYFNGSADFDDDGIPDLISAGGNDVFVARYDAAGDLVFAVRAGGTDQFEQGRGIASDGAGGVFVTGYFSGSSDFDDDGTPDLTSAGGSDVFVARYDAAGELISAFNAGGTGADLGFGVSSDGAGGALVTGYFSGSADFDGDGTPDLTSLGSFEAFVARYDDAGDLVFAVRAGGPSVDLGYGVASDGAGGAIVTGLFLESADFDGDGILDLTSAGDTDIFVAHYDATGALVRALRAGGTGPDDGLAIASDGAGGALVTGTFVAGADFDEDGIADVTSAGGRDAYVARYSAAVFISTDLEAAVGALALTTYPNPLTRQATVRLTLERPASSASVALYDVLGRRVALLHEGPLSAGETSMALDADVLPSGLYLLRAVTGTETLTRRITVVR